MVQKEAKTERAARRGRPRAYDPVVALDRALEVFWEKGFSATSLDDLASAMEMNRPSLYAAFGDKRALYRKALEQYRVRSREKMGDALAPHRTLRDALERFYAAAIDLYLSGKRARGCFIIGTALTEAVLDSDVRADLERGLRTFDEGLEARFALAERRGELRGGTDPAQLGQVATAMLYAIAIRARAGQGRRELETVAHNAVDILSGRKRGKRTLKNRPDAL